MVRVVARQLSVKNCLAAIFASRHLAASPDPLGWKPVEKGKLRQKTKTIVSACDCLARFSLRLSSFSPCQALMLLRGRKLVSRCSSQMRSRGQRERERERERQSLIPRFCRAGSGVIFFIWSGEFRRQIAGEFLSELIPRSFQPFFPRASGPPKIHAQNCRHSSPTSNITQKFFTPIFFLRGRLRERLQ